MKILPIVSISLFCSFFLQATSFAQSSAETWTTESSKKIVKLKKDVRGAWKECLVTAKNELNKIDTLFFIDSYNEGSTRREHLSSVLRIKMRDRYIHKIKVEGEVYSAKSWALSYSNRETLSLEVINFDKGITNPRISNSKVVSVDKNNLILEEIKTGITHYYKK